MNEECPKCYAERALERARKALEPPAGKTHPPTEEYPRAFGMLEGALEGLISSRLKVCGKHSGER